MGTAKQNISRHKRIFLLDELRGFAVFCMVFYHGFYTLAYLYDLKAGKVLLNFFMPAEPWFAGLFILISGIASMLSHSNLKRGAKLLCFALAITLATAVIVPEQVIVFGILHFLSVCMLGYGVWQSLFSRYEKPFAWFPIVVFALLFLFTKNISSGALGFEPFAISLPSWLYKTDFLCPLGFHSSSFFSADYFPFLPWSFVFAAGTVLGRLAVQEQFPQFAYSSHIPFFSWLGKHALVIYLLHQPIIYGITWLLTALTRT